MRVIHDELTAIDRSWMYGNIVKRHNKEYRNEVLNFIKSTEEDRKRRNNNYMCCLCADCKNKNMFDIRVDVHGHLIQRGFMEGYTCWVKHGEQEVATADRSGAKNQEDEDEHDMFVPSPLEGEMVDVDHNLLHDMLHDFVDPAYNKRDSSSLAGWSITRRHPYTPNARIVNNLRADIRRFLHYEYCNDLSGFFDDEGVLAKDKYKALAWWDQDKNSQNVLNTSSLLCVSTVFGSEQLRWDQDKN
uniref:Transposase-associated domain-containing protein n=1 Tax=Oryza brachyantha TaxID=4533 RepID=J3M531_ORYBR